MPTAAKLVGLIVFAGIGFLLGNVAQGTMPEGVPAPWVVPIAVIFCAYQGWVCVGRLAGEGWVVSIGNGIRSAVQAILVGVIYFAFYRMFEDSANLRFSQVGEAVTAVMNNFLQYGTQIFVVPMVAIAVIGGAAGGLVVEAAAQRWR